MASRFVGRDYTTLHGEIIEFLRQRLPQSWDYTNLSDPVVIFAESLARVGDQLHYTIDELRRECDMATAKRTSSIYSYAMREGYKMMLPHGSFGQLSINSSIAQDNCLHLNLKKFDEIKVNATGDSLYVADDNNNDGFVINSDLHAPLNQGYADDLSNYNNYSEDSNDYKRNRSLYAAYVNDVYSKTQHVHVVLGRKEEFNFSYNDINNDSTVELPNPIIDRNLIRLSYTNSSRPLSDDNRYKELQYVDDVISSGFKFESYTLTPKFVGGAITLNIEFPTNFRDIFNNDRSTTFKFEYINIYNARIDNTEEIVSSIDLTPYITINSGHENDYDIVTNGPQYIIDIGNGIRGYTEYEDANATRDHYKQFVQDYSALLTKDDYTSYIKATTSQHTQVFDHDDMYKVPEVLPPETNLLPRVIYIITDADYSEREALWNDLIERSSRSDCIHIIPYGKDPYSIIIKAECYLLGTSVEQVATQIKTELLKYYGDVIGEKIPDTSMINYLTHKASNTIIRMDSCIVSDSTYGTIDTSFNDSNQLTNDQIDSIFSSFAQDNSDDTPNQLYRTQYIKIKHDATDTEESYIEHKYHLLGWLIKDTSKNTFVQYNDKLNIIYGLADYNSYSSNELNTYTVSTEGLPRLYTNNLYYGIDFSDDDPKNWTWRPTWFDAYNPNDLSTSPFNDIKFNDKDISMEGLFGYKGYKLKLNTDITESDNIDDHLLKLKWWPYGFDIDDPSNYDTAQWPDGISFNPYDKSTWIDSDDNILFDPANSANWGIPAGDDDNNIINRFVDFDKCKFKYMPLPLQSLADFTFSEYKDFITLINYKKYKPIDKYNPYPDKFPRIYKIVKNTSGVERFEEISTYDKLIENQIVYKDTDSTSFDIADNKIFDTISLPDDDTSINNINYKEINQDYIKYHYMTPVINNVIVLIKAINR